MKIFTGTVVRVSDKTARVSVTRVVGHPVYKKRVKRSKNYLVHDELGAEVGREVRFVASKPYSKMKRWKIIEVVGVKMAGEKDKVKTEKVEAKIKTSVKSQTKKASKKKEAKKSPAKTTKKENKK